MESWKELAAINLLEKLWPRMLLSVIAKITGGFIIDKVANCQRFWEDQRTLENPAVALASLLGDVKDIKTVIDKFIEYRKDRKDVGGGGWIGRTTWTSVKLIMEQWRGFPVRSATNRPGNNLSNILLTRLFPARMFRTHARTWFL